MAPVPTPAGREAGFTILEVLAAFVLMAVTLAAILQVFSAGLRDAQLADEYARAVIIARSNLASYTASEKLEEGVRAGTEGGYSWTLAADAYDEQKENSEARPPVEGNLRVRLMRVESKVQWQAADGRGRDVRLATLVLGSRP
ncbi:MAG: type II secretion system protein [Burkholderiales bacterium]|nr:type II secretion system protein [Burkholderiales bacterium]